MANKKSPALYRNLLRQAWRQTWTRKRLWVFGMFAAAASTGGVLEATGQSFRRIEQGRDIWFQSLESSWPGFELAGQYIRQLQFLESGRITAILTILILAGVAVAVAVTWSRAALVAGANLDKEIGFLETLKKSAEYFWNVLFLNLLTKAASMILVMLATLPLVLFITTARSTDGWLYFFSFLFFLPAILIVQTISMLALMDIVVSGRTVLSAMGQAAIMWKRHWLAALELALALFLIVFAAGAATVAGLLILLIPYLILLALALKTATLAAFILVHLLGFAALASVFLTYLGAATTFQHTAWLLFYKKAAKPLTARNLLAKLERLWAKM